MSNVATREIAPGVTITSDMTPTQRQEIIAKAHGVTVAPVPGIPFGPRTADGKQAHIDSTAALFAQRDAAAPKAPPSPKELEAANRPATVGEYDPKKVAEFDRELQARGIQKPAPTRAFELGQVDDTLVDLLNKVYRQRVGEWQNSKHPQAKKDAEIGALRTVYNRDMVTIMQGRQRGESLEEFHNRQGTGQTFANTPDPKDAALQAAANATGADGLVDHTAIRPELLSGYTIPAGRYQNVEALAAGLALMRKQGYSQAKVSRIIEETFA